MDNTIKTTFFDLSTEDSCISEQLAVFFEEELASRGFRTEKDVQGCYISELTQVAWFAYCLGASHENGERTSAVRAEARSEDSVPESIEATLSALHVPPLPLTPQQAGTPNPAAQDFMHLLNEEAESEKPHSNICISRSFHKNTYASKSEAIRRANLVSRNRAIPMWVHPACGEKGWHISSHGFDIQRRPDALVTMAELDRKQIESGYAPSSMAEEIKPSVVTRIADSGRTYTQNGVYFAGNLLLEWMRDQDDPAIVLSIDKDDRERRAARISELQESIREIIGCTSFFRWITEDTIVLALSKDKYDYSSARERVHNPYWVIKALTWPNTIIMKEKS